MSAHTRVCYLVKNLEDLLGLRSLFRFLLPTRLGDLPDFLCDPFCFKGTRLVGSFSPQNRDGNRHLFWKFGEGYLSRSELETKPIRAGIIFRKTNAPLQ